MTSHSDQRLTLEEVLIIAFNQGRENDLLGVIQLLPDDKKNRYREIWKDLLQKRQDAKKKNGT